MSNISVGQFFPSHDALCAVVQDWSIKDKFTFRIHIQDLQRIDYRCHTHKEDCAWRIYGLAVEDENGVMQMLVHIVKYEHSCLGASLPIRSTANLQSWLLQIIPQILLVMRETTVQDIINMVQLHHNNQVSYQAAHETKSRLPQAHSQQQACQFQHIPHYLIAVKAQSPFVYTNLQVVPHTFDVLTVNF